MPHTRIIAVANHKGGTAKTTTAVNLAACLAECGRRVLLIDLDPQGNASSWLNADSRPGSHSVLVGDSPLDDEIVKTSIETLSLVPASPQLGTAESALARQPAAETVLRRKIRQPELATWHYVLLDTPPAPGLLTLNALAAADEILIPVEAHVLSLSGVVQIINTLAYVRERLNPALKLTGFVICRFDARTRHSAEVRERLAARFPDKVLANVIRENVRLAEAPSFGVPISAYAPRSAGAADYRALAAEIVAMEKS